jgi:hypothetical protein
MVGDQPNMTKSPELELRQFSHLELIRITFLRIPSTEQERRDLMHIPRKIKEAGATGYILLWLLGIPIPVLLLIFLLRGCT